MNSNEAENGKPTESPEQFWRGIAQQFDQAEWVRRRTLVLSPKQTRAYQLSLLGVPKFRDLSDAIWEGFTFHPLPKKLFEKKLFDWNDFGLLSQHHLETEYAHRLKAPIFIPAGPGIKQLASELGELIKKRELSLRFQNLWSLFITLEATCGFLDYFEPYEDFKKSYTGNIKTGTSRLVEKYIYATWMVYKKWQPGLKKKREFQEELGNKIGELLIDHPEKLARTWYGQNLKNLLIEEDEIGLLRIVADMKDSDIAELITDQFFTIQDFPELSAP